MRINNNNNDNNSANRHADVGSEGFDIFVVDKEDTIVRGPADKEGPSIEQSAFRQPEILHHQDNALYHNCALPNWVPQLSPHISPPQSYLSHPNLWVFVFLQQRYPRVDEETACLATKENSKAEFLNR